MLRLKILWDTVETERKHRHSLRCMWSRLAAPSLTYWKLFIVFGHRLHYAVHQCLVEIEHHGECRGLGGFGWENVSGKNWFVECRVIWERFHDKHSNEQRGMVDTNRHRRRDRWFLLGKVRIPRQMGYHLLFQLSWIRRVDDPLEYLIGCAQMNVLKRKRDSNSCCQCHRRHVCWVETAYSLFVKTDWEDHFHWVSQWE